PDLVTADSDTSRRPPGRPATHGSTVPIHGGIDAVSLSTSTTTRPNRRWPGRPTPRPGGLAEPADPDRPIGLLAGSGRFPILFAQAARRQGLRVACVGIKYEVSP